MSTRKSVRRFQERANQVKRDSSRSVARVLGSLEVLSIIAEPLTNNAMAVRLGVPPASMYRLLKKMTELGYVDYSPAEATYVVSERLAMLGERLADAGCRTPQLRKLMSKIRTATGATVTLWVRTSLTVRLAAVLVGEVPGITSKAAGEIATPFSTPGLAIASRYRRDELRLLITQCRRKQIELGRKYAHVTDIEQALRDVRNRGFAMGYNLRGDGWGMLAWPLDIVTNPLRIGALAIGAPVATLRRDESKVVSVVEKLISEYVEQQVRDSAFDL